MNRRKIKLAKLKEESMKATEEGKSSEKSQVEAASVSDLPSDLPVDDGLNDDKSDSVRDAENEQVNVVGSDVNVEKETGLDSEPAIPDVDLSVHPDVSAEGQDDIPVKEPVSSTIPDSNVPESDLNIDKSHESQNNELDPDEIPIADLFAKKASGVGKHSKGAETAASVRSVNGMSDDPAPGDAGISENAPAVKKKKPISKSTTVSKSKKDGQKLKKRKLSKSSDNDKRKKKKKSKSDSVDKGKKVAENGSEDDIQDGVPEGVTVRKVWFISEEASERWSPIICKRLIIDSIFVNPSTFPVPEVLKLIINAGLLKTISINVRYSTHLVREAIANMDLSFSKNSPKHRGMVWVRGLKFCFAPEIISLFLDCPDHGVPFESDMNVVVEELTHGRITQWVGTTLKAKFLTTKYAILYKIGLASWVPNSHVGEVFQDMAAFLYSVGTGRRINFAHWVFSRIGEHSRTNRSNLAIGYPAVIHAMMMEQHPELLLDFDDLIPEMKTVKVDSKLFGGDRFVDVRNPFTGETVTEVMDEEADGISDADADEVMQVPKSLFRRMLVEMENDRDTIDGVLKRLQGKRKRLNEVIKAARDVLP